ncbi:YdiU family protein [Thiomicrospira microaerophila]|uniref:protein adenylyltransferase SelO n=1 Tax=Thiomicrospira microaerophila TaxID=406020 RepID=UPI00201073CE|nr:YdiU family protein [Thiomicrospira microaerophila]UQB42912.1 YdiU family protein [Thiomicrospira microaerophila]
MPLIQNYRELPEDFYTQVWPEPLANARLYALNQDLMTQHHIHLAETDIYQLCRGELPATLQPLAQKYTGHQFGYYNPDLGDGRGLLLGQWLTPNGQAFDWHLKGAGRTPYSRRGDGRAVLRSVIREYLASEALHALAVPTTRALAIVSGPETVWREGPEMRAMLLRVTGSHIRFGHFEWAADQGVDQLKTLADFVITHHYPELLNQADPYAALLKEVMQRTARLIAHWQSLGFNHGVMNTDNMSILGETFDFGPYAFMDDFKIGYICNYSDTGGRYAYNEQPNVGLWNCQVLAQAFQSLIPNENQRNALLDEYIESFNSHYLYLMRLKLGLQNPHPKDKHLIADLLICLDKHRVDFHVFMRSLAQLDTPHECWPQSQDYQAWLKNYQQRLELETLNTNERSQLIRNHNPARVLRNYIAQHIIELAEKGDDQVIDQWRKWLSTPFEDDDSVWTKVPKPTEKGQRLSCSS